jgi:hypothetical protein
VGPPIPLCATSCQFNTTIPTWSAPINFSNGFASVQTDFTTKFSPISGFPNTPITLIGAFAYLMAEPSVLGSKGDGFSDTWLMNT